MKPYLPLLLALHLLLCNLAQAQMKLGNTLVSPLPDSSSILELDALNGGFLLPRMNYDALLSIPNPAQGLMVYVESPSSQEGVQIYFNSASPEWSLLKNTKRTKIIDVFSSYPLYIDTLLPAYAEASLSQSDSLHALHIFPKKNTRVIYVHDSLKLKNLIFFEDTFFAQKIWKGAWRGDTLRPLSLKALRIPEQLFVSDSLTSPMVLIKNKIQTDSLSSPTQFVMRGNVSLHDTVYAPIFRGSFIDANLKVNNKVSIDTLLSTHAQINLPHSLSNAKMSAAKLMQVNMLVKLDSLQANVLKNTILNSKIKVLDTLYAQAFVGNFGDTLHVRKYTRLDSLQGIGARVEVVKNLNQNDTLASTWVNGSSKLQSDSIRPYGTAQYANSKVIVVNNKMRVGETLFAKQFVVDGFVVDSLHLSRYLRLDTLKNQGTTLYVPQGMIFNDTLRSAYILAQQYIKADTLQTKGSKQKDTFWVPNKMKVQDTFQANAFVSESLASDSITLRNYIRTDTLRFLNNSFAWMNKSIIQKNTAAPTLIVQNKIIGDSLSATSSTASLNFSNKLRIQDTAYAKAFVRDQGPLDTLRLNRYIRSDSIYANTSSIYNPAALRSPKTLASKLLVLNQLLRSDSLTSTSPSYQYKDSIRVLNKVRIQDTLIALAFVSEVVRDTLRLKRYLKTDSLKSLSNQINIYDKLSSNFASYGSNVKVETQINVDTIAPYPASSLSSNVLYVPNKLKVMDSLYAKAFYGQMLFDSLVLKRYIRSDTFKSISDSLILSSKLVLQDTLKTTSLSLSNKLSTNTLQVNKLNYNPTGDTLFVKNKLRVQDTFYAQSFVGQVVFDSLKLLNYLRSDTLHPLSNAIHFDQSAEVKDSFLSNSIKASNKVLSNRIQTRKTSNSPSDSIFVLNKLKIKDSLFAPAYYIKNRGTQASLNMNGAFALRSNAYAPFNQVDDYVIDNSSFVNITNTTSSTLITGIAGGYDGRYIVVLNASPNPILLVNQSTSSFGQNQIFTGTGSDLLLGSNQSLSMIYDASSICWRIIGYLGGMQGELNRVPVISRTTFSNTFKDLDPTAYIVLPSAGIWQIKLNLFLGTPNASLGFVNTIAKLVDYYTGLDIPNSTLSMQGETVFSTEEVSQSVLLSTTEPRAIKVQWKYPTNFGAKFQNNTSYGNSKITWKRIE